MIYAGIGSRKTPAPMLKRMKLYAANFALAEFTLRSGAAPGADEAFEAGCDMYNGKKEIYIPWGGFNGHPTQYNNPTRIALEVAAEIYGDRWGSLKGTTKKLMARNVQQVMGENVDQPCDFVLCWTPDGCNTGLMRTKDTGGTGQAIATATKYNIPVFNLGKEGDDDRLVAFLEDDDV